MSCTRIVLMVSLIALELYVSQVLGFRRTIGMRTMQVWSSGMQGQISRSAAGGCICFLRQCSDCSLSSDPFLTKSVSHVKALGGGKTSQIDGTSAWHIKFTDDSNFVAKFKAVSARSLYASAVGHLIGVATPRVWFTPKQQMRPDLIIDNLARVAEHDSSGSPKNDAARLQNIFKSDLVNDVDGILCQDYFSAFGYNHFLVELGLSGISPYVMIGRMVVLDWLEAKSDAFNDIGPDSGAHKGLPQSEEIRENNLRNFLGYPVGNFGEIVDIDLGDFSTSDYNERARSSLGHLVQIADQLKNGTIPGALDRQKFPQGRIPFVQKEVGTLLCLMKGNYRNTVGGCGGDRFAVEPAEAIEIQLGIVEAWQAIANGYDSIREHPGGLKSIMRPLGQVALNNLDIYHNEAKSVDLPWLLGVYQRMARLPEDDFYSVGQRCCVLYCFRLQIKYKDASTVHWDKDKPSVSCTEDNKVYAHAFQMMVPEHKECRDMKVPLPQGYDFCWDQCAHVGARLVGGYQAVRSYNGVAERRMSYALEGVCMGEDKSVVVVPAREWQA